jgi:hypothetical protein
MTTHGTDRLRRSLDNQRKQGAKSYELAMEDMERLVREVEEERDRKDACVDGWAARCAELMQGPRGPLASDGKSLRIGETVWGQDGRAFTLAGVGPEFVWGRTVGRKTHKRLRPEWLTHAAPDTWERVERDARTIDECCTDLMSAADLVARCKKLAGVE